MMRYQNVTHCDQNNGDGLRVVLWVSGCEHHCPGCQNPCTWDRDDGEVFDDKVKAEIFEELENDYISGITFSGGDPLATYNRPFVIALACEIKEKHPDKTIWCYTGYTIEELKRDPQMEYFFDVCDVVVDGRYEQDKRDVSLPWRGSSNQRVLQKGIDF